MAVLSKEPKDTSLRDQLFKMRLILFNEPLTFVLDILYLMTTLREMADGRVGSIWR